MNMNSNINETQVKHPRIRSAHHITMDKEKLYEENLELKNEMNKLNKALNKSKKENCNLEGDLNKKDKMLEELAIDTQNSMINQIEKVNDLYGQNRLLTRATETHLIINIKKQFKEMKKDFTKKSEEYDELKKTLKSTKVNELTNENNVLLQEISKLKTLYDFSLQQNNNNEKYLKDFMQLKDNYNRQEYIIITLQENMKKLQDDLAYREEELKKNNKSLSDKIAQVSKLKKDLKFQYQINERLIMSTANIKQSSEYIAMKNEMDKKLNDYKRDCSYYKDLAEKREKRLKDLELSMAKNRMGSGIGVGSVISGNSIYSMNSLLVKEEEENPEEKTNHTILLLKSKLQEVTKERDEFRAVNEQLRKGNEKDDYGNMGNLGGNIGNIGNIGGNNLLYSGMSGNNYELKLNSEDNKDLEDYEYLNENRLNELIYILIKNFEANKIDSNIIEERVLKDGNSNSLLELLETNEKEFSEKVTNNILNLLKV